MAPQIEEKSTKFTHSPDSIFFIEEQKGGAENFRQQQRAIRVVLP